MTLFLLIALLIASVVNYILLGKAWDEIHMLNRQHAQKCSEYDNFIQWHNREEVAHYISQYGEDGPIDMIVIKDEYWRERNKRS